MNTDTPRTNEALAALLDRDGELSEDNAPEVLVKLCKAMERERDEARELCRWTVPRLRAMCHDFDSTATGWACAEKMDEHSDIFTPNA